MTLLVNQHSASITPHTYTRGKVISLSLVVVSTKIASLGDLGTQVTCKANKFIGISEKVTSVCLKSFCTGHEHHK